MFDIDSVERLANGTKLQRLLNNPYKYANAILYRELQYRKTKQEKAVKCATFFGTEMTVFLPSSSDIYLNGGKSHDSELRLAKFMMANLKPKDIYLDVGAHYGYFSLLAARLVSESGKVVACEASPTTYRILAQNAEQFNQISVYNYAASSVTELATFYEFPNLYSEYNAFDVSQFAKEDWFADNPPRAITIQTVILDELMETKGLHPSMIKIDVEGAEFKVLSGLQRSLLTHAPVVVMEYLSASRGNEGHIQAEELLRSLNYFPRIINPSGQLEEINSIAQHLDHKQWETDNIVFVKS